MKKIIFLILLLSTIVLVINLSKTESFSYKRKLIKNKKSITLLKPVEKIISRKEIKSNKYQPVLVHDSMSTTIEDQEERLEDATYDIQWLNKEWNEYLDIVLRERLKLDQQIIENYYKNKIIYSDKFNHFSQLIEGGTNVQENMGKMIYFQKQYEKERNNILGLETVKIINQRYIKEFNDENSYFTRNKTGLSSF